MLRILSGLIVVLLVLAAIGAYLTFFIVKQTDQALVLRFGKPERAPITSPGLHWKLPVIDTVQFFDKRILDLDSPPQEVIASDQKRLVVDSFARWKIINPLLFYQAVGDEDRARARLSRVLEGALRRVLGAASFQDILRDKRDELMLQIRQQVNEEGKSFGMEVVDVRIKRADLPQANSEAIYRRMQTERQREAAEFRANGEAESRRIKSKADRDVVVIIAEATRDGQIIRGEGDAERNRIFAEAFSQDAEFFAFYRSMQAYVKGLGARDTRMLMSPGSDFFRYFNDPSGKAPAAKAK